MDDWNDLLAEEKMVRKERETGKCARCNQPLPKRGATGVPVDQFGFRLISMVAV